MQEPDQLFARIERLVERLDALYTPRSATIDWEKSIACLWRHRHGRGDLEAVRHPHRIRLADLHKIDEQKNEIDRNTRQFLAGLPANNALLWGARGMGKSSLVKAAHHEINEAAGGTWEDDAATHWAGLRLWAVPATTLQEGYAYMTYLDETPATDNDKKKVVATRSEHVAGIITRTLPPPFPPVTPPPQIPD